VTVKRITKVPSVLDETVVSSVVGVPKVIVPVPEILSQKVAGYWRVAGGDCGVLIELRFLCFIDSGVDRRPGGVNFDCLAVGWSFGVGGGIRGIISYV